MRKNDKIKQIINIILVLIWMIIVFSFSNEKGNESSNTSRGFTIKIIQLILNKPIEENEILINNIEKVIRKLAHYSIYTVGGFLIINSVYGIQAKTKGKVIGSISFGMIYAVTDELHQFFVPGRSARIFDVGIDTLGVITGVCIYLIMVKIQSLLTKEKG